MKPLFAVLALLAMSVSSRADETTIQDLRNQVAQLKVSLAKAQEQAVSNFSTAVEMRTKYEAAIQRINEANDVARQWRSQAMNLKSELNYTRALARNGGSIDLVKTAAARPEVPHFRITNIASRPVKDAVAMR